MATAQDAARARDEAEPQAEALYRAAVAYVAAQAAQGEPDEDNGSLAASLVGIAAVALAVALIRSSRRRYGSEIDVDELVEDVDEAAEAIGDDLARTAIKDSEQHLSTIARRERKKNPDVTDTEIRDKFRSDEPWKQAAARTLTTEAASQSAIDLLPLVDDATGERHELLWVSRGDHKVRSSHRKLHGQVRKFGKPFKRIGAQQLRFPGDPMAPLGEVINCRCALLLVPAAQARSALDVFKVSEAEWAAIDSLRASVGWDVGDEAERLRAQADLVAERTHGTL